MKGGGVQTNPRSYLNLGLFSNIAKALWESEGFKSVMLFIAVLFLCSMNFIDLTCAQGGKQIGQKLDSLNASIAATTVENESTIKELIDSMLVQYNENLNYSSLILSEFVKKNITRREAMEATVSLYVLTSRDDDKFYNLKPIKKFADYYNYSESAVLDLERYLLNISKYYETGKITYAAKARESFNSSQLNYEKAKAIIATNSPKK